MQIEIDDNDFGDMLILMTLSWSIFRDVGDWTLMLAALSSW